MIPNDTMSHTPATHAHPELGFLRKYIFSEDHKIIGIQFLFSGIIFPVYNMPKSVAWLAYIIPFLYSVEVMRLLVLTGNDWTAVGRSSA